MIEEVVMVQKMITLIKVDSVSVKAATYAASRLHIDRSDGLQVMLQRTLWNVMMAI